jgi:hypothetical protein
LWEEVLTRDTEGGYSFEKHLAQNLLPLPIDHRLDEKDIQRLIQLIMYIMELPKAC